MVRTLRGEWVTYECRLVFMFSFKIIKPVAVWLWNLHVVSGMIILKLYSSFQKALGLLQVYLLQFSRKICSHSAVSTVTLLVLLWWLDFYVQLIIVFFNQFFIIERATYFCCRIINLLYVILFNIIFFQHPTTLRYLKQIQKWINIQKTPPRKIFCIAELKNQ